MVEAASIARAASTGGCDDDMRSDDLYFHFLIFWICISMIRKLIYLCYFVNLLDF